MKEKFRRCWALVLIVPAVVVLVIVALISPVDEPRYIYNLVPAFVLAACLLLYLLEESLGSFEREGLIKTAALLGGFTTVILLLLFSASIIMISLGIIGYYIARIYDEIKGRPRYIISRICGREDK